MDRYEDKTGSRERIKQIRNEAEEKLRTSTNRELLGSLL